MTRGVSFLLRLKNCFLDIKKTNLATFRLIRNNTGTSLYFQEVRVRKRRFSGFDIACKWKRNYQEIKVKNAWFILTNLGSLPVAIAAYKKPMGREEMFRDYKTGSYNI